MKYQIAKMNGCKVERVAIIEANNRVEANEQMSKMAKELESILYLGYYSERYHNDVSVSVIATATHTGEIINY